MVFERILLPTCLPAGRYSWSIPGIKRQKPRRYRFPGTGNERKYYAPPLGIGPIEMFDI